MVMELDYQELYNRSKKIINLDACKKFYNASKPFYLETDASGISLGVGLLQVRRVCIESVCQQEPVQC